MTGVESGADEEEVRDACTEHCVSVVGAGLLPPRLLHSPYWPSSPFVPLCKTGKGPRGCLRMAAPALRVRSPRLKPLAEVSVHPSRRRSGLWGLVCLSIFVLLQINSKPSSELVSQMELGPCQVLAPWFLNNSKATKRRGAAVETLEQQVPGASAATGTMAGVGWKGVCAQPVMREGLKLRHLQDLPQLSLQSEPELAILAVEASAFPRDEGGRADPHAYWELDVAKRCRRCCNRWNTSCESTNVSSATSVMQFSSDSKGSPPPKTRVRPFTCLEIWSVLFTAGSHPEPDLSEGDHWVMATLLRQSEHKRPGPSESENRGAL